MRSNGKLVLWPQYFDASLSWAEGRRVPKGLAVRQPRAEDIGKAASDSGYSPEFVKGASHPRYPYSKTGLVLVQSKDKKTKILREIASRLQRG